MNRAAMPNRTTTTCAATSRHGCRSTPSGNRAVGTNGRVAGAGDKAPENHSQSSHGHARAQRANRGGVDPPPRPLYTNLRTVAL